MSNYQRTSSFFKKGFIIALLFSAIFSLGFNEAKAQCPSPSWSTPINGPSTVSASKYQAYTYYTFSVDSGYNNKCWSVSGCGVSVELVSGQGTNSITVRLNYGTSPASLNLIYFDYGNGFNSCHTSSGRRTIPVSVN